MFSGVIMQRNTKGYSSDFQRYWSDYKRGFGSINGKTYWLGLDTIHDLTKSGTYSLEIILKKNGQTKTVTWSSFSVANESNKYRLSVSGFDAGSSGMSDYLDEPNGMFFSTRDRDNDVLSDHCSTWLGGYSGWWFNSCGRSLNRGDSKGPQIRPPNEYYDESTMILKR